MATSLPPSKTEELLAPLLSSLPSASISPSPPDALLPLLSPILRQRVQLLSSSSNSPWLPLLSYNTTSSKNLEQVIRNERFEPHPVSGEVEVDWETEVETGYKRVDEETLHAFVKFAELGLSVKCVWCTGDEVGGGDGWRIGEVLVLSPSSTSLETQPSISQAEEDFETKPYHSTISTNFTAYNRANGTNSLLTPEHTGDPQQQQQEEEEEDDADYWAQYDNTPARTPATKRSPVPPSSSFPPHMTALQNDMQAHVDNDEEEESYYAQYASVQPAMDSNDPDEAVQNGNVESSLGHEEISSGFLAKTRKDITSGIDFSSRNGNTEAEEGNPWSQDSPIFKTHLQPTTNTEQDEELLHPRPASAHSTNSSSGNSSVIDNLESHAAKLSPLSNGDVNGEKEKQKNKSRELSEVGIKQHISTSVKSLYRLARVAGIERGEFERIVKREIECLGMMDEDD